MSAPDSDASMVMGGLARLAAAGLQLPVFLVMTEKPAGTFKWLDADLVTIARQWEARSCGEHLSEEAIGMALQIARALTVAFDSVAATPRQRRLMAWEIRRRTVFGWLARTGVPELNAAARAWLPALDEGEDEGRAAAQAAALIDALPELSSLRAALRRQLDDPPVPEDDGTHRICGMRGTGA